MNLRGPNDWTPLRRQRVHRRPAAGFIMKVGLFVTLEHEAHENATEHLGNLKEQVRTAKDAGFDSIWLPQHFITGPSMRQSAASPMDVVDMLAADTALPRRNFDYPLTGDWSDHRDCYLRPDLIPIYRKPDDESLELVRLGSHSELGL